MRAVITFCDPGALGALEGELDREFVTGRGRSGALRDRYPLAFEATAGSRFLVLRDDHAPRACLAGRPFSWRGGARDWRGVMIGLVYTAPAARGRGFGSRLLREALTRFAAEGSEFAVLWSGIAGFYETCGFRRADRGRFGTVQAKAPAGAQLPGVSLQSLSDQELAGLEGVRSRSRQLALAREPLAWRTTPLPAEVVHVLRDGPAAAPLAYLLAGMRGTSRIVYELAGDPASFPALWSALIAGAGDVFVNDVAGSPSSGWLAAHASIDWRDQNLALWAPLTQDARGVDFGRWYIPYFDRL